MRRKRSNLKKGFSLALAAALGISLLAGCGSSSSSSSSDSSSTAESDSSSGGDKEVNLLVWEGYAEQNVVDKFTDETGIKVNATYFNTSDDLAAKLKAGGGDTYDVISPSGDMAGYIMQNDMAEPLDMDKLENWDDINESVKLDDVVMDGKTYGVPYLWGPDYLIYDADVITEEPTSWNVLWDEKYSGRLSLHDDISNIYMIGQMDGIDKEDKNALYNMSDDQLKDAQERLTELNSHVRKYWVSAGELEDLFANKEVDIAVGWPIVVNKLNEQGRNLKWTIPQEGCTGWMDRLMIVKGAKHMDAAYKWINYQTSGEGEALTSAANYYTISNPKALDYMDEETIAATNADALDEFFAKINFWQYVENRDKYNDVWTAVKAGS